VVVYRPRAVTPPAEIFREPQPGVEGVVSRADRFLSRRTVSGMTGDASKRKIRDWVDRGEFNSYALDGKTVYSEREVLDFLERVKARAPRAHRGVALRTQPRADAPQRPEQQAPRRAPSLSHLSH